MKRLIFLCLFFISLPFNAWADNAKVQLSVWANEAIVATYTFNFNNFLERQKEIAKYFTTKGWMAYSEAFTRSGLPEAVTQHAYYVSSVAAMPPEIEKIRDNYWKAVMPLLVVYKNPQYQQKQTLQVTIDITQTSTGGVRGFAITALQAKVIEPPCRCPTEEKTREETPDAKHNTAQPQIL